MKEFIKKNPDPVNDLSLALGSLRNTSEHAGAVILTPTIDDNGNPMEIFDWFPVKKVDGHLVSEYTGSELDKLGFLKNDFLGLSQLCKVKDMFKMIKDTYGKEITFENIPLDDKKVYWMFSEGYTQDIFQFNSSGMTGFLMDLQPDNIEHLISANALYRPGAMSSDFDKEYVELRHGRKIPEFIEGTEEALKDTYGLMIYQENTISLAVHYAGFSMSEGDSLRAIIGKKKVDEMPKMKNKFLDGARNLGRNLEDANKIWEQIERTAEYQFNRSHSAAYAQLGYTTMYLKAHYPLVFYTVALQHAKDDDKPKIIAEMNRLGEVKVSQPDINESGQRFKPNFDKKRIYWSLVSVKWVGEKAVEKIIGERKSKGKFFSVKDLFDRVDKRTVNKRAITNLILAGAFDEIYDIKQESDRIKILKEYYNEIIEEELPEEFKNQEEIWKNHWWILKSLELTGLGYINYDEIIQSSSFSGESNLLVNLIRFNQDESIGQECILAGVIDRVIERKSKRGVFVQININHNSSEELFYTMWNETYVKYKKNLKNSEGSIILAKGIIKHDHWKKCNVVHSNDDSRIEII